MWLRHSTCFQLHVCGCPSPQLSPDSDAHCACVVLVFAALVVVTAAVVAVDFLCSRSCCSLCLTLPASPSFSLIKDKFSFHSILFWSLSARSDHFGQLRWPISKIWMRGITSSHTQDTGINNLKLVNIFMVTRFVGTCQPMWTRTRMQKPESRRRHPADLTEAVYPHPDQHTHRAVCYLLSL